MPACACGVLACASLSHPAPSCASLWSTCSPSLPYVHLCLHRLLFLGPSWISPSHMGPTACMDPTLAWIPTYGSHRRIWIPPSHGSHRCTCTPPSHAPHRHRLIGSGPWDLPTSRTSVCIGSCSRARAGSHPGMDPTFAGCWARVRGTCPLWHGACSSSQASEPPPSTLHPAPTTLHPPPSTLPRPPSTLHPPPCPDHPPPSFPTLPLPP